MWRQQGEDFREQFSHFQSKMMQRQQILRETAGKDSDLSSDSGKRGWESKTWSNISVMETDWGTVAGRNTDRVTWTECEMKYLQSFTETQQKCSGPGSCHLLQLTPCWCSFTRHPTLQLIYYAGGWPVFNPPTLSHNSLLLHRCAGCWRLLETESEYWDLPLC